MNLDNKTFLITGGTGSFGKKLIKILLKRFKVKKIVIFSRDEFKQQNLKSELHNYSCIRYFIGDIRDLNRLKFAMQNVDIVIHAAALKNVPFAEYNPFEVVKTNVIGSQNVIDACIYNNVEKVIALSTDKASSPINLYGATKLTSDKLFIAANNYVHKNQKTRFAVVRYGNVFGSRGSIFEIIHKHKKSKIFNITDMSMTRFNITLEESVNFVLKSITQMWGGEIFIPKIPSYKLSDVVEALLSNVKIITTGLRPGEKIHEEMISNNESINVLEFKDHYVIIPSSEFLSWNKKDYLSKNLNAKLCSKDFSYKSDTNKHFLSIKEIIKVYEKNSLDIN